MIVAASALVDRNLGLRPPHDAGRFGRAKGGFSASATIDSLRTGW